MSRTANIDDGSRSLVKPLLLTPEQAAAAIAIGRSKMYELLAEGVIESVRIGSRRRIPASALEDFVERLRAESREERSWAEIRWRLLDGLRQVDSRYESFSSP